MASRKLNRVRYKVTGLSQSLGGNLGKFLYQDVYHGNFYDGFARFGPKFIVPAQAAVVP